MVWGPTNCGKTTLLNPILAFIPHQNVATLTKEGRFSLAMVNRTTELTFVDEFEAANLSAEQAKQVLQGMWGPQYSSPITFTYTGSHTIG